MSENLSEGEIDFIVQSKLSESGWKLRENMTYQHSYAPGRIFPKKSVSGNARKGGEGLEEK